MQPLQAHSMWTGVYYNSSTMFEIFLKEKNYTQKRNCWPTKSYISDKFKTKYFQWRKLMGVCLLQLSVPASNPIQRPRSKPGGCHFDDQKSTNIYLQIFICSHFDDQPLDWTSLLVSDLSKSTKIAANAETAMLSTLDNLSAKNKRSPLIC